MSGVPRRQQISDVAVCVSSSDHSGSHPLPSKTETTPSPTNSAGNGHPEYIAYALVPVFFVMGLFGVLICHLLKKKGYRCTTEAEQDVEGEKVEKIGKNLDYILCVWECECRQFFNKK